MELRKKIIAKRLDLLTYNHAGVMRLNNGITSNYGVIRKENNELLYFTGKGLREIWAPDMSSEQKVKAEELRKIYEEGENGIKDLIKSEHIARVSLDDIERVLF